MAKNNVCTSGMASNAGTEDFFIYIIIATI